MFRLKTLAGVLALALILSLVPMPAAAQPETGTADFTRYVAIGDSLTAGFMSGGLGRTARRVAAVAGLALMAHDNDLRD